MKPISPTSVKRTRTCQVFSNTATVGLVAAAARSKWRWQTGKVAPWPRLWTKGFHHEMDGWVKLPMKGYHIKGGSNMKCYLYHVEKNIYINGGNQHQLEVSQLFYAKQTIAKWWSKCPMHGGVWLGKKTGGLTKKDNWIPGLVNIQKTMENHHFSWENPLFQWSFSIAMLKITRG